MNRILDIGYPLRLGINDEPFIIRDILGKGASSVTYLAECNQTEHVLKECNPLGLHMHREDNGGLVPDTELNKTKFDEYLSRFVEGANKQLAFRLTDDLKNTTSNVQAIYYTNNTVYIDMTFFSGSTYDEVEDESLYDLLRRMKALVRVIGHYHDMGYLHLDIKPQNIYAIPETPEMVMMFDFDSVIPAVDVEKTVLLSYTDSWAAPEQKMAKYRKSICKATDLFAIGEIIFYRVMGRHSNADERFDFSKYAYDKNAKIFENVNPQVFGLLDDLFHKTLCCAPANRVQNAEELIALLEEIIPLANPKEPFLVSTLPTPKEFFIGRDDKIEEIHARLQQSPVLFLHGIGGIGKSELAKQYAKKYRNEYDTVVFAPYITDIVSMIADDTYVHINQFQRFADEKIEAYYERKLSRIKALVCNNGARVLFLVDNFDIADDPHTNVLIDLGCRVLVTSRVDFEHEYSQVELDKISNPFAIFNEYYKKPLSDTDRDIVNEIIEIIGGHTMTVELLAKQMMASRIDPTQMLKKLKSTGISDSGKEKVRSSKDGKSTMQSTYEHIQMLFDLSNIQESEKYVLANLSLIPYTGIPANLFGEWCELESFDTLNQLIVQGWIHWDKEKDYVLLHPVIREISSVIVAQQCVLIENLVRHLSERIEPIAFRDLSTVTKNQYLNLGLAVANNLIRIGAATETIANLLSNEIWCDVPMSIPGGFEQVEKIYLYSLKLNNNILNGDDSRTILTYYHLACLYGLWDKTDLCERCLHDGIMQLKNIKIKNPQYYLCEALLYHGIGLLHFRSGTRELFKQAFIRSIKAFKKTGSACSRSISSYIPLIQSYRVSGKYYKAIKLSKQALKIQQQYGDIDAVDSAHIYYNLANIFATFGKLNIAEQYYLRALRIFNRQYDGFDGYTGMVCLEIGNVYLRLGDLISSEQYLIKAISIHEVIYGADHYLTSYAYILLSIVYDEQQKINQSEEYLKKSMEANLQIVEKNEVSESTMALCYYQISHVLVCRERFDEALRYIEKSHLLFKKVLGKKNQMTKLTQKLIRDCVELSVLYNQIHSQVNDENDDF